MFLFVCVYISPVAEYCSINIKNIKIAADLL